MQEYEAILHISNKAIYSNNVNDWVNNDLVKFKTTNKAITVDLARQTVEIVGGSVDKTLDTPWLISKDNRNWREILNGSKLYSYNLKSPVFRNAGAFLWHSCLD